MYLFYVYFQIVLSFPFLCAVLLLIFIFSPPFLDRMIISANIVRLTNTGVGNCEKKGKKKIKKDSFVDDYLLLKKIFHFFSAVILHGRKLWNKKKNCFFILSHRLNLFTSCLFFLIFHSLSRTFSKL